ncbi:MAG: DNA-formamidopyrimidine glycosylase [Elusimicrobiota bacterium]
MPELPEVEGVLRSLLPHILNKKIESVRVYKPLVVKSSPQTLNKVLSGSTLTALHRHGKSLFFNLKKNVSLSYLKVHLGMTGQLLLKSKDDIPDPYTRVRIFFQRKQVILDYRDVRQFGKLLLVKKPYEPLWGPDAWLAGCDILFESLRQKKGTLKHALLNQSVLAGVGNIYADESLFLAKLHPEIKMEKISDLKLKDLIEKIKFVLGRSIEKGGTTFRDYLNPYGEKGNFLKMLNVYGREGEYCKVCQSKIEKILVASRGTHFCPTCQPGKVKIK